MARIRTFIGVGVGDAVRGNAVALQKALAQTGARANWVAPANLHVTLFFLGEVDTQDLPGLCRAVSAAAAGEPPFVLRVAGVGAFPTPRRPKTVWAGVTDGADRLVRLHGLLEGPLLELGGYRAEVRAYTPHLTLGRVKAEEDGQLLAAELPKHLAWAGGHTAVEEVVVFGSELRRDGPVYTPVGRGRLRGRGDGD